MAIQHTVSPESGIRLQDSSSGSTTNGENQTKSVARSCQIDPFSAFLFGRRMWRRLPPAAAPHHRRGSRLEANWKCVNLEVPSRETTGWWTPTTAAIRGIGQIRRRPTELVSSRGAYWATECTVLSYFISKLLAVALSWPVMPNGNISNWDWLVCVLKEYNTPTVQDLIDRL